MKTHDIFLSHAREDKHTLVEPLVKALNKLGIKVWFDKTALSVGDSLLENIDRGLAESIFGAVVLSPAFFAKRWPKYEADALLERERRAETMILTVWHNLEYDEVAAWSPALADRLPIRSQGQSIPAIAIEIIKIIRPDILTNIHKRMAALVESAKAKSGVCKLSDVVASPVQHQELPSDLLGRIRLIRASLLSVYPHSFEFWLDGFRRDSHPTENVAEWEHIAAVFQEYVWTTPLSVEQQASVFAVIVGITNGMPPKASNLPHGAVEDLTAMLKSTVPQIDPPDEIPFRDADAKGLNDVMRVFYAEHDKERFPKDPPKEIVRELLGETARRGPKHSGRKKKR